MKRVMLLVLVVLTACVFAAAGAQSSSADTKTSAADRFRDCRALGGGFIACCAAVGGTLGTTTIDGKDVLTCTIVNTPSTTGLATNGAFANKVFPVTNPNTNGANTSGVASNGASNAGTYGLVTLIEETRG
jgi:hypothetical protein